MLSNWPVWSASDIRVQAFLQRIIDQHLDFLLGHRGIFASKLPLAGRSVVAMYRSPDCLPLTGLLIECLAFHDR